jgi:hypothetical protein
VEKLERKDAKNEEMERREEEGRRKGRREV